VLRKSISLVLIDDHPLAPEGVATRIRAQPGFEVLVASAKIAEAIQLVRKVRPELVLLSLRRKGNARLALADAIQRAAPESRLVLMGFEPLGEDVASYVRAGASGFIMAGASFGTVLHTLRCVAVGDQVLPPELAGSLFGQLTARGAWSHPARLVGLESRLAVSSRMQVAGGPLPAD
jgi:DNA-binding NarL/FixJ family response regulator